MIDPAADHLNGTMTGTMPSWRTSPNIAIHPAAEMFPLLPADELADLARDIKATRLREKCAVITKGSRQLVIDGRNRLDALERAGFCIVDERGRLLKSVCVDLSDGGDLDLVDPARVEAFIISKNIHRRHLSADQKRELAAKLLRTDPAKSNRSIAEHVKLDKNTVQSVRADLETGGEIHHVEERVGKDGKAQPAEKKPSRKQRTTREQPVVEASDQLAAHVELAVVVAEPANANADRAIVEPQDQPPHTSHCLRDLPFDAALASVQDWFAALPSSQQSLVLEALESANDTVGVTAEPVAA
jgi:hypothetical protein